MDFFAIRHWRNLMGTRKSERFENHMDVSVPETQGDATIQEEFSE